MPRTGLITATLITLASLAALGSEAGVTPVREALLAIPLTGQLGGDGTRPVFNDDAFVFQTPNSPKRHQRRELGRLLLYPEAVLQRRAGGDPSPCMRVPGGQGREHSA